MTCSNRNVKGKGIFKMHGSTMFNSKNNSPIWQNFRLYRELNMSLVLNLLLLEMLSFTSGPQAGAKENSNWKFIKFVKKRSVLKIAKLWLRWLRWSSMMGTNTLSSSLGSKIMQCSLWFHPEIPKSLKSWINMHVSCSVLAWWCVTALTVLNMYKALGMYVHDSSPYGFTWNRREFSWQVLDHLTIDFLYHGSLPLKGSLNSGVGPLLHLLTILVAMSCWFLIPKSRNMSTVRQGRFEMFLIFWQMILYKILFVIPMLRPDGSLRVTYRKHPKSQATWSLGENWAKHQGERVHTNQAIRSKGVEDHLRPVMDHHVIRGGQHATF